MKIEIPNNDQDDAYFSAADSLETAMADSDGPDEVGVYQLIETKSVKKVLEES